MTTPYSIVLITVPTRVIARSIARHLIEKGLAACVNLIPSIESIYSWEGNIQTDEEILMVVKTRAEMVESELIPAVKSIHPYDVPEILALPIEAGSQSYLDWIKEVTK
jgi:periplasmic divalent cation tolerance protein